MAAFVAYLLFCLDVLSLASEQMSVSPPAHLTPASMAFPGVVKQRVSGWPFNFA